MTEIEIGDRELLIQSAGDARDERGRHEDRREHERDADDRAGHFLHRSERRVARRQAVLDVMLDRFDDDDRVVDDETDREHEAEERERVDAKAEQREEHERADERHGHGAERDQGRAPALQKDEDDDDHEHERLDERLDDLVDAGGDRARGIERDGVGHVGREVLATRVPSAPSRPRPPRARWCREAGNADMTAACLPSSRPLQRVGLRAEFDARDILHAQQRAVRVRADDDRLELLDAREAARVRAPCR